MDSMLRMAYPLGEDPPPEEPPPNPRWAEFRAYSRLVFLGCAGLLAVVVLLCICFGVGSAIMGPVSNPNFFTLKDAGWNEKLAAGILLVGIIAIGVAPFWLNDLIHPGTAAIMTNVVRTGW